MKGVLLSLMIFIFLLLLPERSFSFFFKIEDKLPPEECRRKYDTLSEILLSDDFLKNKSPDEQISVLKEFVNLKRNCFNFYRKEYLPKCPPKSSLFQKSCFKLASEKGFAILSYSSPDFITAYYIPLFKKAFCDSISFYEVFYMQDPNIFIKIAEKKEADKPFCYLSFGGFEGTAPTLVCPKWHLEKGFKGELKDFVPEDTQLKTSEVTKETEIERPKKPGLTMDYSIVREMIEWLDKEFGERGRKVLKRSF